ncbi:MAG: histidine phosphatase family protein [Planctomycetota bacterium]
MTLQPPRLILMRHAKSDWSDAGLDDHSRPLNRRGRRDAPRMAQWLADSDLIPDVVLLSDSVRTTETLDLMIDQWSDVNQPICNQTDDLYLAAAETIVSRVNSDHCDAETLLVLAHNPGISVLASRLAGTEIGMPTAAMTVLLSDSDWSSLRPTSRLQQTAFVTPKSLGDHD